MSIPRSLAVLLLCVLGACAEAEPASIPLDRRLEDTMRRARESSTVRPTAVDSPSASQPPRRRARGRMSPLADSIARDLVFVPPTQTWFVAAARGKRLMIDIGRADVQIGTSPERIAALREVARLRSPLPVGTRVRVHGAWGADDAIIADITLWSDRIVALIRESPRVDSLARRVEPLPAIVRRVTEPGAARTRECARGPLDAALLARAAAVRDSLAREILAGEQPPYQRLRESLQVASSRVPGCYGAGRLMLIVSVRAGGFDWVRERFAILDDSGRVHPLATPVYRQRAHDGVVALDADEDGVDELAVRVLSPGAGALSIFTLRGPHRLLPMANGFAWEAPIQ